MREALILLAIAGLALAQPAPHPYIGAGGCASSNCHGGTTALPAGESRILGNEYATWSVSDKHARAYKALEEPRGKRMAEILRIADATRDKRCTVCHVVGSPEKSRSDGVACEACHGPAEQWLGHPHPPEFARGQRQGRHDRHQEAGDPRQDLPGLPSRRPRAGGGSRTDRRGTSRSGLRTGYVYRRAARASSPRARQHAPARLGRWARRRARRGHAAAADPAEKSWPEFSDLECYQCHHDLRAESWRIQRGYAGRKPGALQVNTARIEIVRDLVSAPPRISGGARTRPPRRLNAAGHRCVRQGDRAHRRRSDATRFQTQDIDAAAVLRAVTANIQRIADGGVSAAEQATMTLDALGAKPDATAPLYDYLEHPSTVPPRGVRRPVPESRRNPMRTLQHRSARLAASRRSPSSSCSPSRSAPNARSWAARAASPRRAGPRPPNRSANCRAAVVPNRPCVHRARASRAIAVARSPKTARARCCAAPSPRCPPPHDQAAPTSCLAGPVR